MVSRDDEETWDLIVAAGGILEASDSGAPKLCIIHRDRHGGEWSLPKGKQEDGESLQQTALREVEEETGCAARFTGFAGVTHYYHGKRPKIVLFWRMSLTGPCRFQPSAEVRGIDWVVPSEALHILSHEDERELVKKVYGFR